MIHGELEHQIVEPRRGHAGNDMRHQQVERAGGELPGLAHAGKGLCPVQHDLAVALLRCAAEFEVVHSLCPFGPHECEARTINLVQMCEWRNLRQAE